MAQLDIDFSKQYLEWLKQNIEQYQIRDSIFRITLPFLDRNNDCVEVYIVDNGDGTYQITDDGATINDLEFSGFDIETSERRKKILNSKFRYLIFKNYLIFYSVNNQNVEIQRIIHKNQKVKYI